MSYDLSYVSQSFLTHTYIYTVVTWKFATSEPMEPHPIFFIKTTNLPYMHLLFSVNSYSKNTKILPNIQPAHILFQLVKLSLNFVAGLIIEPEKMLIPRIEMLVEENLLTNHK